MQNVTDRKIFYLYGENIVTRADRIVISEIADALQVSYTALFIRLKDLEMFVRKDAEEYLAMKLQ